MRVRVSPAALGCLILGHFDDICFPPIGVSREILILFFLIFIERNINLWYNKTNK